MHIELENIEDTIKRKHVFKYKPEYTELFQANILESQIIPLAEEIFEKLEWPVVYVDKDSIEAKRMGDWKKLTEKITVTKTNVGLIKVHSKSIDSHFWDLGKNSKRTGLFLSLFKKLSKEYAETGKLSELENEFERLNSFEEYKIPIDLPKPKSRKQPNQMVAIIGGLVIAGLLGVIAGFVNQKFSYFIGAYEVVIAICLGFLFSRVLKFAEYVHFNKIRIMIGVILAIVLITNLYVQYYLIILESNITTVGFIEFIKLRIDKGLTVDSLNTGSIGLVLSWIFQIVFPFFLAQAIIARNLMNYAIEKIPKSVIEFSIYLFTLHKSEGHVRAELSNKGWTAKVDQDDVFAALSSLNDFQQFNRE